MNPRPRIGLSSCFLPADPNRKTFARKTLLYVEQSMIHWVASGGAVVYPVPTAPAEGPGLEAWVDDLDGLVLHGGSDVAPESYGEEAIRPEWAGDRVRDLYEIDLLRRFVEAGKPVLGICRGIQVMNVAFGGTLFQDLLEQGKTERAHRDGDLYDHNLHEIDLVHGGWLDRLYGGPTRRTVNSIHHQAIRDLAQGFEVAARSTNDGIVEAIRMTDGSYLVGVQWHPEFFVEVDAGDVDGEAGCLLDNGPFLHDFLDACLPATARREMV